MELAIAKAAAVWQHEERRGTAAHIRYLHGRAREMRAGMLDAIGVAERDIELLIPEQSASSVGITTVTSGDISTCNRLSVFPRWPPGACARVERRPGRG